MLCIALFSSCSATQHVAECCRVLQSVAVCCGVLQCVAMCCYVMEQREGESEREQGIKQERENKIARDSVYA